MGRLEGPGVRRTLADPNVVKSGDFRADALEGPGVEQVVAASATKAAFAAARETATAR